MLMLISAMSWPEPHNSASLATTWPGDGRKSGRTRPAHVLASQRRPSTANTAAAMPRNSAAPMRPPRVKRRAKLPALLGRRIHEPRIDGARKIDILLQDAGGAGRLVDFRNDLGSEIAGKFRLVLGERIIDDAVEGGGELFGLGANGLRNDGAAARGILAIISKGCIPDLQKSDDLARLLLEEFLAHHEDVGDEPRILARAVDHLDLRILLHRKGEIGLIGDGDRHLAGDQGRARVRCRHWHLL